MRLRVHFKEEQDFKVDLKQSNTVLHSDFGEIITVPENNYNNLINKPSINGVELVGNKTGEDLDLGSAVFPSGGSIGDVLTIGPDTKIAWLPPSTGTIDYNELINKPAINGITLDSNQSAADLGLGTYSLPSGGIPVSDLSAAVQASLSAADSAYTLPSNGIPISDLSESVQASLSLADSALQSSVLEDYRSAEAQDIIDSALQSAIDSKYELPQNGIPKTDLSSAVQSSLDLADTALQPSSIDSALSDQSTNPVQNKVIKQALDNVTSAALPSGGEAGQILMKTSNVDYVTEWVSPANQMEQDNTRPITSGAVYTTVGNIQQLLALI